MASLYRQTREAWTDECCFPGCKSERYPLPDAPPVCGKHLVQCGSYIADRMGQSLVDPHREMRRRDMLHYDDLHQPGALVYYVRLGDHVKIGFTTDLPKRLASLHVAPDNLLATEAGGLQVEKCRHGQFAAERAYANRELFNPSPRLLAHIKALRDAAQAA